MFRVDTPTAATELPAILPAGDPGFFTQGTAGGIPATVPGQDWFNTVQEELMALLAAAGIAANKANRAQVLAALEAMFLRTDGKKWVAVAANSVEVGAGAQQGIALRLGGVHRHYRVSIYAENLYVYEGELIGPNGCYWLMRAPAGAYDELQMKNGDALPRMFHYEIHVWE